METQVSKNGAGKNKTIIPADRLDPKGGSGVVEARTPYVAEITITGTASLLMHRRDVEEAEAKERAGKGSKTKKTDNLESFVYRDAEGFLVAPAIWLKSAICEAGRFHQDPRSPRKSMRDILRAALRVENDVRINGGLKEWEFVDKRQVKVQRQGIIRHRPGFLQGWTVAGWRIRVVLPEYVVADKLHELIRDAGMCLGIGDFRPDFGVFRLDKFEIL